MKFTAIAALLGAASAVQLRESPDCPASVDVFSYNERTAPAAGLIQLSSCQTSGAQGVECIPNHMLFATGMEGNENLGESITMKGEGYSYGQHSFAQKGFASGMEGTEDLGQDITMKGEPYHYAQKKFASGMEGTEDLNQDITMKGEPYHYAQWASGMEGTEDLGQDITMKGEPYHYSQRF